MAILILILVTTISSKSQSVFNIGGAVGFSSAKLSNVPGEFKWKNNVLPKIVCQLPLRKKFWLQTEIGYYDKGYKTGWMILSDTSTQLINESRMYLQVSELAGYSIDFEKLTGYSLSFVFGIYYSQYLRSIIKEYIKYSNTIVDQPNVFQRSTGNFLQDDEHLRQNDIGVSMGLNVKKKYKWGDVFFELRYDNSVFSFIRREHRSTGTPANLFQVLSTSVGGYYTIRH